LVSHLLIRYGKLPLQLSLLHEHSAETVAGILSANPAAAKVKGKDKIYPLQLAQKHGHTAETVAALLAAFPAAGKNKGSFKGKDGKVVEFAVFD